MSEYYSDKSKTDGKSTRCKTCKNQASKAYNKLNSDSLVEYRRQYYVENADKIRGRTREWLEENRERKRETDRVYAAQNKDKVAENMRRWLERNPDGRKLWRDRNPDYDKRWKAANPEKVKEKDKRAYDKKKDLPSFRINSAIRAGVTSGIRKGSKAGRKTFELLGYSLQDLMSHLESLFAPGMTWENYGEWHIDHKVPLAVHNYETPNDIDFKRAWALSNLQPLWAEENLKKQAKLDEPFQPSLAF